MKRTFGLVLVFVFLASSFLSACEPTVTTQQVVVTKEVIQTVEIERKVIETQVVEVTAAAQSGPKGTFRAALNSDPASLYPMYVSGMDDDVVNTQMYEPLITTNNEGKMLPVLAESWDISPDGLVYTFHLRHGVTFHNGEPFTADDVIATWKWGMEQTSRWPERYKVAKSVEKIDDYTVKLTTDGPQPLLPITLREYWVMLPNEYLDKVGIKGFEEHPIGTGPFMFVEWVKGDHITLKAYPNYWQKGFPKLDTIIFRPIPDSATRIAAIQRNEIDLIKRLNPEEAQSLLSVPGVKVISYPTPRIFYIAFNNQTTGKGTPIENVQVRLAMNYAVNVEAIIDALFGGFGKRSTGMVAQSELGYGNVQPFTYDPEKAKQLLAEAGYANGFTVGMACPSGAFNSFDEVCDAVVGYLRDVGITINLDMMEPGHFWDLQTKKELVPMFGDSWSDEEGEGYYRLTGLIGPMDSPWANWTDPKIEEILTKIGSEVDRDKRKALYEELQSYMIENPPFIYLYETNAFEAVRETVQNYTPGFTERYYLLDTWLASKE